MRKLGLLLALVGCAMGIMKPISTAYAQQDLVSLVASVGFDGRFRENTWTPVLITISNNGDPIEGELVARPERSSALTNTFSTPVTLPSNARQTVMMYVTLRSFGRTLRIELFDTEGVMVTDTEVTITSVPTSAQLYAVVSNATSGTLNVSDIGPAGTESFQANWFPINVPDSSAGLEAVDVIFFTDVDSGTLNNAQRGAIKEWVTGGGHLIVAGGSNWQGTAAGLTDLLPMTPSASTTITDLSALAAFVGSGGNDLLSQAVITTGEVAETAQVLIATADDTPLYVRRLLGNGTVDYLAVDPALAPLRGWNEQSAFWLTVLSSVASRPGWTYGMLNPDRSVEAMEILPGITAIPEALAMVAFLAAYVLLIGPINYLVLSRLNRREFAWVTIPLLIAAFSGLAWATGFNLRGSDVILSRLSVVESWPNSDHAQVNQLIGLLAPRRATYSLSMSDQRFLRPISPRAQSGLFGNTVSSINIQENDRFAATEFLIDSSRIGGFTTTGTVAKPAITGQVTISYDSDGLSQVLRGTVRNDSDLVLHDPVILFRGIPHRMGEMLAPGDLTVIGQEGLPLSNEVQPAPSPLEYEVGIFTNIYPRYRFNYNQQQISEEQSAIDVLGQDNYSNQFYTFGTEATTRQQELYRRQVFLNTFMIDQYNTLARGNRVYLAAWSDFAPTEEIVEGASWRSIDTTLYLVELDVELIKSNEPVTVSAGQFTWFAIERIDTGPISPNNLMLTSEGQVAFRFTPLPDAILSEVRTLNIMFEREGNATNRTFQVNLWNWEAKMWETIAIDGERSQVFNPARFIGPLNAVQIQVNRDLSVGSLYIGHLGVEQHGVF